MTRELEDVVVIGGGIVGLATALALQSARPGISLVVLEKEPTLAAHQTGHNSGVIHAGLYYKPGSLKAITCGRGRRLLERFCEEHDVAIDRCGKTVVATRADQVPRLDELERRGRANGLMGIRRLGPEELREIEPNAAGVAALSVPETAIVDYAKVLHAYAGAISRAGGRIVLGARATRLRRMEDRVVIESTAATTQGRVLIACAGLESDRVARRAGLSVDVSIIPFRGEYWLLSPERSRLVRNLIYPVPDPAFPFLGVHFTRRIGGGVEAGPNAVLALAREGYSRTSFSWRDTLEIIGWPGFWRMARRHWRPGIHELARSWSRRAFARACAQLVPEVTASDLTSGGAGVRAQAVTRQGALADDFIIVESERMIHTLNAPSPAATASLAIGQDIAARAMRWL
ncbi:MAG: L-2-hydroxyglutarate oxidase [Polyangiaceae bacterium]|jgi:L-2-hydroxyglutarate oxidase LhgO